MSSSYNTMIATNINVKAEIATKNATNPNIEAGDVKEAKGR